MPAFFEEYQRENNDMRRQAFVDWRERFLRVEDSHAGQKTKEEKEAEKQANMKIANKQLIEMFHNNPQLHFKELAKELEHEMFCLMNKRPYTPRYIDGLPGYWDYRKEHGDHWILETRERLPYE
jgi:hypothetical protein